MIQDSSNSGLTKMNVESQMTPELDAGITIARAGNRYLARQNLNRLAEDYADNPNYWIWMAWLSESISEMNYALERVLALDPHNSTAQAGLQWAKRLSILAQIHTNRNASGLFKNELPWQSLMTSLGKNKLSVVHPQDEPAQAHSDPVAQMSDDGKSWEEIQQQEFPSVTGVDAQQDTQETDGETATASEVAEQSARTAEVTESPSEQVQSGDQSDVYFEPIDEPEQEFNEEPAVDLDASVMRRHGYNYSAERSKSTVLVLEHSPTIRKLLQLALSQSGYRVLTSSNENEAVTAISKHNPDLIVVDTEIPGGGGYRLCKQVRRSPESSHIELVLLSDREGVLANLRRRRVGCSEYLPKPFTPLALIDSVDRKIGCSVSQTN
ncbi:MAG TPA: response regulator [Planctomycetaceae bacterium]|nr:response regulator [Planctomycetaceae bacterium]